MFCAWNADEMKKSGLYCTSGKIIHVNYGLIRDSVINDCISNSDVPYIANLPFYFDIFLGGEREVSN